MLTIYAECGINYDGDIDKACYMVEKAAIAGASAAKFQLFTILARPRGHKFIKREEEWRKVMQAGEDNNIPVFFSVFDFESVYLARELGAKWVKLSFVERRNRDLIERCNKAGFERKIISVDLQGQYDKELLSSWEKMYCPNNGWSGFYPTRHKHIDWHFYMSAVKDGLGWHDHCEGFAEAVIAASLGAKLIEKHFKIDDDCPDAECSLSPKDFVLMRELILDIMGPRFAIQALDTPLKKEFGENFKKLLECREIQMPIEIVDKLKETEE